MASLLARDGGGLRYLVAEKGNRRELPSIYATNIWSGVGGLEKLNKRGVMRMIIRGDVKVQTAKREVRNVRREMRSTECEIGVAIAQLRMWM